MKHVHELAFMDLEKETIACECGYIEAADPSDITHQYELLKGI